MKAKKDYLAIAELLNIMRLESKNKTFDIKDLQNSLKGILPISAYSRTFLVRANILVRVGRGLYAFPKDPIHWKCVADFYDLTRKSKRNSYQLKIDKSAEIPVEPTSSYNEKDAVEFLKSKGYFIFKMM